MLVVTQFLSTESRLNVEPAAARNLHRSEGGFHRSVGSKAEHNGWPLCRKAAVHAQPHLVVYKHELEMEAIRIIRVELLCRVENWFVWIL